MNGNVVIVGAGPTGLALGCLLARQGVATRIVDRRNGISGRSKAIVLWSRTLEVFDALDIADDARVAGLSMTAARYTAGRVAVTMRTDRIPGTEQAPVILPQDAAEALLHDRFLELGGEIAWGTQVRAVDQDADGVRLTTADGELIEADYVVGCDGLHSTVRECAGIPWQGSAFEEVFQLGDVTATVPLERDGAHHFLGRDGFVILVPLPGDRWRIVGAGPQVPTEAPTAADLQRLVDTYAPAGVVVGDVVWSDVFRITRRLAGRLRDGRVLLAGDAAHVHSPAGGQGLNTGVQDAHNLAWKLVFVLRHGADPALLDSYDAERRPVAQRVLKITDLQAKYLFLARGPVARLVRGVLLRGMGRERTQRTLLPDVAQLTVDYAASPLTVGGAGTRATALTHEAVTVSDAPGVRELVGPFGPAVRIGEAATDELLAVRPDGHIGFRGPATHPDALRSWLTDVLRLPVLERSR